MQIVSILFLAAWALLAAQEPAHAGFIVGAISAIGSFLASGTLLAQIALGALFTAARIGIGLLTKAKQTEQTAGINTQATVGGDNPLSFIVGRFATSGQREYINTWGQEDEVKNDYLTQVFSLGDIPVGSLTGLWVGDQKVTVPDMTGAAPYPQGWPIAEFHDKDEENTLWIRFHDGRQTTADDFLTDTFGADPDRPWSPDMIGRGVPYVVVTAEAAGNQFSGIPTFVFEVDGIDLYDVTKDSSVGGSGPHRWDDPSTWEPSDNPAVQVYNILRGISYDGEWLWGGQTIGAYALPEANWIAAVNACNAPVALSGGGTEPAYRSGGEIKVDQQPADVIDDILAGCSGRIAEVGGIYKVLIGAPGAAVYSFTDDSIIVTKGQSLDPFPGLEETYNAAQASYPEPDEKWQSKDAPGYFRPDLEVLDDNRRLPEGLQYPYTPYAVQVQRLLKAAVDDARRFRQHQFYLPPEAWLLEPNDVVAWTSERNSYDNKKFIVVEIEGGSNFLQLVTLKEVDPADYSWNPATDQKAYSTGFLAPIRPGPQALVGWQVEPATFYDGDDNARRPSIAVLYSGGLNVESIRVQVRLKSSGTVVFDGTIPYDAPEKRQYTTILNGVFLPNTQYEARGIYVSRKHLDFEWSIWLLVTTPNVLLTSLDVLYDGIINRAALAQDVKDLEDFAGQGVQDLIDQLMAVVAKTIDQDAGQYRDKQTLTRNLRSQYRQVTAEYSEAITVATGPGSALATAITQLNSEISGAVATATDLYATEVTDLSGVVTATSNAISTVSAKVDDVFANVTTRATAVASPGGGWARYAIEVQAAGSDEWSIGAFYIDVKPDLARVIVDADQFIITDGTNTEAPFVFTNGEATLAVANIGTVKAGILQDRNGNKMVIDLAAGSISVFT